MIALAGDLTDPEHRRPRARAARDLGRLDILFNNASTLGATPLPPLAGYPLEELEDAFRVNVLAPIALVREKKPEVYMRVVADLLPKEANINVEAGEAFVNLWRRISDGLGEELADSLDAEQGQSAPVRH